MEGRPDLAPDLLQPPDLGPDLQQPPLDLGPDLQQPPPDLGPDLLQPPPDLGPDLLQPPPDLLSPADLSPPPDLLPPPDLTPPDLTPPPRCDDGARNGDETDIDCGGPLCARCADGLMCLKNRDCESRGCRSGVCGALFDSPTNITTAVGPRGLALGDFNKDGHLDVVTAHYQSAALKGIGLLLGDGHGGFGMEIPVLTDTGPVLVVSGDLDGDGNLDVVASNFAEGTVSLLWGDGNGGFAVSMPIPVARGPFGAAIGDLDGDGRLDIAVAGNNVTPNETRTALLFNRGNREFSDAVYLDDGTDSRPAGAAIADYNGDGRNDVAVANYGTDSISLWLNDGVGGYTMTATLQADVGPYGILTGDFNGDGRPDLAVNTFGDLTASPQVPGAIDILLGHGDGSFQPFVRYAVGLQLMSISAADLDGDGILDVTTPIYGGSPNYLGVLFGEAGGSFFGPVHFDSGPKPRAALAGDFDEDGLLDLVIANYNNNEIGILLNQGQ